jgi:quinolinate synthase
MEIIAHPECSPDVVAVADFTGSTSAMINYVKSKKPPKALLVTECSMASNVAGEATATEFIAPCNLCPHMKRITLSGILDSLLYMQEEVTVDPAIAARARRAVERMINLQS